MSRTALLVLDMQSDFLGPDGRLPADAGQVVRMIPAANALIDRARERAIEIVFIANAFSRWDALGNLFRNGAAIRGTAGAGLDPRIHFSDGDPLLEKSRGSAFSNPALGRLLAERGIGRLAIAGVMADHCVLLTARAALKRGLRVAIPADAVASATEGNLRVGLDKAAAAGAEISSSDRLIGDFDSGA